MGIFNLRWRQYVDFRRKQFHGKTGWKKACANHKFQKNGLTLVSILIFGAVSLANLMNCLGSRVRTTISPDFCTALNAAAVEES